MNGTTSKVSVTDNSVTTVNEESFTLAEVQARIEANLNAIKVAISVLDDQLSEITADLWQRLRSDRGKDTPYSGRGYDYVQNLILNNYMEYFRNKD